MEYKLFSLIGLGLDILGVIMLFKYGLPSKVIGPPKLLSESDLTPEEMAYNSKVKRWAYTGLSLLIAGFAGQLLGVILQ